MKWPEERIRRIFFPQPLVDGFSKLWLRGKGNLRVETLSPAEKVEWPCWSSCLVPKIRISEGVISLHKFFTKSVISGSKCPKSKNLEIWNSGDPKLLFLEGVIFLYKFFTKSMISGSKRLKSENSKFARACSCLLVLSLCLLASQCGLTVLRSAVPETD